MGRTAYVRPLTEEEIVRLETMMDNPESGYRAKIILYSNQGYDVRQIERSLQVYHKTCLKWIRAFNKEGLEGIKVKPHGGSKPDFSPEIRARIVDLARTPPQERGLAFGNWSLRTLVWYVGQKEKLVPSISYEGVRVILKEQGLCFQKSRLVAESHDPEYEVKKGLLISS